MGPQRPAASTGPTPQSTEANLGCTLLKAAADHLHGKEGVSGSSPEEGSAKAPEVGAFRFAWICTIGSVRWVWSPLWSLPGR
jgi:hypothetical protein